MSGLMIKDCMLLKRQGRYFIIVLVVACMMAFTGSENFSSFMTSYLTFMITIFSFSSFSYDEYDNGMAYLMALPSGRRNYVKAKYLFSILLIMVVWFLGCLLRMAFFLMRFSAADYLELLPTEPIYLLVCLIYVSGTFPAILKYGAEKGRNVAFTVLAFLAIGVFMIARFNPRIPVLRSVSAEIGQCLETSPLIVLFSLRAVFVLVLTVSYLCAVRIMEKKEF